MSRLGALPRWGLVKSVEPRAEHWVTKANANKDPCDFIDSKDVELARLSIYYVSHQACVKKTFPTAESKPLNSPAQTVLISAGLFLWGWKRKRLHKHIKPLLMHVSGIVVTYTPLRRPWEVSKEHKRTLGSHVLCPTQEHGTFLHSRTLPWANAPWPSISVELRSAESAYAWNGRSVSKSSW